MGRHGARLISLKGGAVRGGLRGVGAQYDGVMKVGVPLKARIECTAWEQDPLLELTSVKGGAVRAGLV